MSPPVTVKYNGKIAVITIDNEKKLNALDADGYYLLAKYMREVATHDEVFITVLTGKGMFPLNYMAMVLTLVRTILLSVSSNATSLLTQSNSSQWSRCRNLPPLARWHRHGSTMALRLRSQQS
jgi:hypothetical protein